MTLDERAKAQIKTLEGMYKEKEKECLELRERLATARHLAFEALNDEGKVRDNLVRISYV